jgi:hypothetical protein
MRWFTGCFQLFIQSENKIIMKQELNGKRITIIATDCRYLPRSATFN